jgi:hypothetical protein
MLETLGGCGHADPDLGPGRPGWESRGSPLFRQTDPAEGGREHIALRRLLS